MGAEAAEELSMGMSVSTAWKLGGGGSTYGGETEARLMTDALEKEFGVAVRWSEGQSRTTHENARYSAAMLQAAGVSLGRYSFRSFMRPSFYGAPL